MCGWASRVDLGFSPTNENLCPSINTSADASNLLGFRALGLQEPTHLTLPKGSGSFARGTPVGRPAVTVGTPPSHPSPPPASLSASGAPSGGMAQRHQARPEPGHSVTTHGAGCTCVWPCCCHRRGRPCTLAASRWRCRSAIHWAQRATSLPQSPRNPRCLQSQARLAEMAREVRSTTSSNPLINAHLAAYQVRGDGWPGTVNGASLDLLMERLLGWSTQSKEHTALERRRSVRGEAIVLSDTVLDLLVPTPSLHPPQVHLKLYGISPLAHPILPLSLFPGGVLSSCSPDSQRQLACVIACTQTFPS